MIKAGTYRATVVSHAISETREGNPQAVVTFGLEAEGTQQKITWYGSFKEKALPHTIKGLLACGLKGNNPAGALEVGKEVEIVIENDTDDKGKMRSKVRWVNKTGVVRNVIAQDMAKSKLEALTAAVMAAREEHGISDSDDEIPF